VHAISPARSSDRPRLIRIRVHTRYALFGRGAQTENFDGLWKLFGLGRHSDYHTSINYADHDAGRRPIVGPPDHDNRGPAHLSDAGRSLAHDRRYSTRPTWSWAASRRWDVSPLPSCALCPLRGCRWCGLQLVGAVLLGSTCTGPSRQLRHLNGGSSVMRAYEAGPRGGGARRTVASVTVVRIHRRNHPRALAWQQGWLFRSSLGITRV